MLKKFVCLAKSAREGGFCIAGKEILANGGIGNWFRPIGSSEEALSIADCRFTIGNVVTCEVSNHAPSPTQPENYIVALRPNWQVHGVFPRQSINLLVDSPLSLWSTGFDCSSRHGMNDKIPLDSVSTANNNSLYFVRIAGGTVTRNDESFGEEQRIKTRLTFLYKNQRYSLVVTDPVFTRGYGNIRVGESKYIGPCYLTISLAKPFNNYCYKLVAGHVL